MRVFVLRLGHRRGRDQRMTTHVGLTARALGCEGIILSGEKDESVIQSIRRVVRKWGDHFKVKYVKNWRSFIKEWKGKIVHLTMYGLSFQEKISEIRKCKNDLLIIVGSQKVPFDVYNFATWNISVTNQPHSEVAALAIFLDKLFMGKELKKKFENAKVEIVPQKRGKKIKKNY